MKWQQFSRIMVLSSIVVAFFPGCRTAAPEPEKTPASMVNLINRAQEKTLCDNAWNEVGGREKRSADPQFNDALQRVGQELGAAADRPGLTWETIALENKVPRAFVLANGKIGMTDGMFAYTVNDAELAALLAQELAHALLRHNAERISRAMAQQVGGKAAVAPASAVQTCGIGDEISAVLPYSSRQELAADQESLMLMAKAGYDPRLAIDFWQKILRQENNPLFNLYFAAHPLSKERLNVLSRHLTDAVQFYQLGKVKRGSGQTYTFAVPTPEPVKPEAEKAPEKPVAVKPPAPNQPQLCSRNDLGFAIRMPLEWTEKTGGMGVTFSSPNREEIISIQGVYSAQNGGSYIGVSELVDAISNQISSKHKPSRVYSNDPADVQGRVGQEFSVDLSREGRQYRQWFVVFPRYDGKMFYVFSYTASTQIFSEGKSNAKKIFRTFTFLDDEQEGLKKRHASPLSVDSFLDNGKSSSSSKSSILGL